MDTMPADKPLALDLDSEEAKLYGTGESYNMPPRAHFQLKSRRSTRQTKTTRTSSPTFGFLINQNGQC